MGTVSRLIDRRDRNLGNRVGKEIGKEKKRKRRKGNKEMRWYNSEIAERLEME